MQSGQGGDEKRCRVVLVQPEKAQEGPWQARQGVRTTLGGLVGRQIVEEAASCFFPYQVLVTIW